MKLRAPLIALALAAGAAAPMAAMAQAPVTATVDQQALLKSSDPKLAANKKLVYDMWRTLLLGGHISEAPKFLAEDYIQHNPQAPTGRAAFMNFFKGRPEGTIPPNIPTLVSIVAEGDLVTLAFVRELPEPTDPTKKYTTTWFDMFRVKDGVIREHWDIATKAAPRPAGAAPAAAPPAPR